MKVKIEVDSVDAEKSIGRIKDNYLRKAVRRSIKETGRMVSTALSRGVRDTRELRMNIGDIKKRIDTKEDLKTNTTLENMRATITVDPNKLSLHRFRGVRSSTITKLVRRRGWRGRLWNYPRKQKFVKVTARILGQRYVTGGFFRTVNGNTLLLKRKGTARYPLRKLFGTSMADIVRKTPLENKVRSDAASKLQSSLQRNLAFYTNQTSS